MYGDPRSTVRSDQEPTGNTEWPIVGLVVIGGVLLAVGGATGIRRSRVRRGRAGRLALPATSGVGASTAGAAARSE